MTESLLKLSNRLEADARLALVGVRKLAVAAEAAKAAFLSHKAPATFASIDDKISFDIDEEVLKKESVRAQIAYQDALRAFVDGTKTEVTP
jgi:hypothetical protein